MEELEKLKQEIESLHSIIKKLRLDNLQKNSDNLELSSEKSKLSEQILALKIENIAELKSSKILFKMVAKGYTHRQKNDIAYYANSILDIDINEKICELKDSIGDLPF
jgi:hypothetical protein